jgi:hypothetical protein
MDQVDREGVSDGVGTLNKQAVLSLEEAGNSWG